MNFLEIVQRTSQKCGIPGDGPSTVVGQSGEFRRLINWCDEAWLEIQEERPDWRWMRKEFSFQTVAETQSYSVATIGLTDHASWRNDSFRIYLTSVGVSGETFLTQYDYNSFRDFYLYSTKPISYSRPTSIAVSPSEGLVLGLPPDDIYTIRGEYFTDIQSLTADSDIPNMPARFHLLIVYSAMMKYGSFESAPEVFDEGSRLYNKMFSRLQLDQGPYIGRGESFI